jgi:hypothetical protein
MYILMNRISCLAFLLLSLSSSAQRGWKKEDDLKDFVAINDSVYIYKYEVKVGEYSEYLNIIRIDSSHGFYLSQFPDSSIVHYLNEANTYYKMPYYPGYFDYPGYRSFPVIGLSYEQAENFCKWKTRTYRSINEEQEYLLYRLPSPEEWRAAATPPGLFRSGSYKNYQYLFIPQHLLDSLGLKSSTKKVYETSFNVKDIGMFIYKDSIYKFVKTPPNQYMPREQPETVYNSVQNKRGLFHLEDNVSEMTSVPGLAKGLNFLSNYKENVAEEEIHYSKPEPWLGFRIVAQVKHK